MEWLIFALIGQFLLAIAAVFGKIIRTKIVPSSLIYFVYVGFISSVVVVLTPFIGFTFPTARDIVLVFLSSIPYAVGLYLLIKSYALEEISRISVFRQMQPIFVLVLAIIFLGEILSKFQYLGFFFLFAGSVMASYKSKSLFSKMPSNAFWIIMAQAFLWAIYFTLVKYTYSVYGFWNAFILIRMFLMFYSVIILIYLLHKKMFSFKKIFTKGMAFLGFNEFMVVIAAGFLHYALFIGKASLVSITESTAPVFVLFIASFFSIKFPNVLKEEINKKIILQKIVAIVLVTLGLVFLSL